LECSPAHVWQWPRNFANEEGGPKCYVPDLLLLQRFGPSLCPSSVVHQARCSLLAGIDVTRIIVDESGTSSRLGDGGGRPNPAPRKGGQSTPQAPTPPRPPRRPRPATRSAFSRLRPGIVPTLVPRHLLAWPFLQSSARSPCIQPSSHSLREVAFEDFWSLLDGSFCPPNLLNEMRSDVRPFRPQYHSRNGCRNAWETVVL
jgi:hypothetical protein